MHPGKTTGIERPRLLIVDDRPENLYVLEKLLSRLDVAVKKALSGYEALNYALEYEFCAAIVDIQMPEMDGYELVELLRSNVNTANLPVIFVSAIYSDEYHHRKAYESGAVDFLSKPFIPEILLSKIQIFIDLYQQRKALERLNAELKQANIDKDKFFSIISHDLRAPFNVLLGFAQFLEIRATTLRTDEVEEIASSIYSGAKAAYSLLDNLLTWSRLQREKGLATQPETFDLNQMAQEALKIIEQSAAAKEITLENIITDNLSVYADRRMVDTIIRNLAGNAIKFTPRGGKITITAIGSKTNGTTGYVTIGVRDTGVGMSPDVLARLFQINVHHSTEGTEHEPGSGLGLIICREMVERNDGKIWAESEPGKGTTFWFTMPAGKIEKTELAKRNEPSRS